MSKNASNYLLVTAPGLALQCHNGSCRRNCCPALQHHVHCQHRVHKRNTACATLHAHCCLTVTGKAARHAALVQDRMNSKE